MKIYPNLAGSLRFYFGLARALAILFGAFWFVMLTFSPLFQKLFLDKPPRLMVSVGEMFLETRPTGIAVNSDTAKPGSVDLFNLRASLQADLFNKDTQLVSALRSTVWPSAAIFIIFSWLLFGSLRELCANIERREVFSEKNLRLVRNSGLLLIGYSVTSFLVHLWGAHAMNNYLAQHVTWTGVIPSARFPDGLGSVRFGFSGGIGEFGLVAGCTLLLFGEAFRQGLNLKTENDLTV